MSSAFVVFTTMPLFYDLIPFLIQVFLLYHSCSFLSNNESESHYYFYTYRL